jgi:hypothetical protein
MQVGNFSVLIPEGRERESGYVQMDHGAQYSLRLGNNDHSKRCDATVLVDGKEVGAWRINAGQSIVLERPVNDTGRFTFYKSDSQSAEQAGVGNISSQDRGLVQVTFRPEKAPVRRGQHVNSSHGISGQSCGGEREEKTSGGILRTMSLGCVPASMESGMTGLSGQSSQQFDTVAPLDYDPSGETIISIRLVAISGQDQPRELKATPKANQVPNPV